ncbi:hypothetical protein EV424DRAFT_1532682 [Suillus variegatus]|nr:hypothetical protein EV424DRAFT_1532682 [Suillus variegatus]
MEAHRRKVETEYRSHMEKSSGQWYRPVIRDVQSCFYEPFSTPFPNLISTVCGKRTDFDNLLFSFGINGTDSEIRCYPTAEQLVRWLRWVPMTTTRVLLETRLAAAQNSAMAKASKCRPPNSRAKSTGTDAKENLDPHAVVTATADKRRTVLVAWSKPENHHLTDSLLTLIEESNTYRKAFGFALLPGSGKVASTGNRPANLYRQLATALFL